jgi:hypothetical protein
MSTKDYLGFGLQVLGCVLAASGYVWLLCRAFQRSQMWGTAIFILPPLVLVYFLASFRRTLVPVLVLLLGAGVVAAPRAINYYQKRYIDLGPRIKDVDGQKHITLTGWDKDDYSFLEAHPETVVLQMANPDVKDQTLTYLQGMTGLQKLDLNTSKVTDEGLRMLGKFPNLRVLRLWKTRITDEGFRESILPMDSLEEVEIDTTVTAETLREWKAKKAGRRGLRRPLPKVD